jgi:hypothetical protein
MNNRIKMTDSKFKCNIFLFLSVTVFMARLSILSFINILCYFLPNLSDSFNIITWKLSRIHSERNKFFTFNVVSCLLRCPGQNKRTSPLHFFHGYRKRRLNDHTCSFSHSQLILVKCGCLDLWYPLGEKAWMICMYVCTIYTLYQRNNVVQAMTLYYVLESG